MLNITVPVFDLGRSYENVKSGKSPENVWKRSSKCLKVYFQNCVGTLQFYYTRYIFVFIFQFICCMYSKFSPYQVITLKKICKKT